ncbi:MAG: hypothetical protein ACE5GS_17610, partial [Kiloniellaceae bacterium]
MNAPKLAVAAVLAAALLWPPGPAAGQSACAARAEILTHLAAKFGETRVASGVTLTGALMLVTSTRDGASWSLLISLPDG